MNKGVEELTRQISSGTRYASCGFE